MLGHTSLRDGAFVTVDIETTGCRPGSGGIIEIGAVRIESGRVVASFDRLVRPNESIPPAIRSLTGISDEMVASATQVEDAIECFRAFADGAVIVAHNHRFDMGFLDYEAERVWGTPFPRPVLDTLALARRLHPELERHNLRQLAEFYGSVTVPNHRAYPDALATAEILQAMLGELFSLGIHTAGEAADYCGVARQGALSDKLVLTAELPDASGIYLFRDADGAPLYVGRAKSLRTRVRSHFYAPADLQDRSPAAKTASIQHAVVNSPLDALLLESRLLERYRPSYNRDHGVVKTPHYIHLDTSSALPVLRVVRRRFRTGVLLGPVSNEWAVRTTVQALTRHFGLRLCVGDAVARQARCRFVGSGLCPEPCAGTLSTEEYRSRADAAVSALGEDAARVREAFGALREQAAAAERYEDAIAYRDAVRALDRTVSALGVAAAAAAERGCVLVEVSEGYASVLLTRVGYLVSTLRFSRARIADGSAAAAVRRAMTRAYGPTRAADDRVTARRLRDITIIETYRRQHHPAAVHVGADSAEAAERVISLIGSPHRTLRKSHAVPSAG